MGRKRALKLVCTDMDNPEEKPNMSYPEEDSPLGNCTRLVSMPDLPIKVQRRIVKRNGKAGQSNNYAKPIFFKRETQLSRFYRRDVQIPYIEQVFTSLKQIGNGSFGDVYEGKCKENQKKYAIKVSNDNHSLLNYGEIRRLENIPKHRHCVKYYGAWEQCYRVYILMELCSASLDKVVTLNSSMKEIEMWDILVDIALGLQHLHHHNMIHLDVKPSNIMVTSGGVCKLGDFGLVYNLNDVNPITMKKRRTGLSVSEGDGRYVAPEVLGDGIYTFFGDVYSFGLMMLEIGSNTRLPSSGKEWENIRREILPEFYKKQELSKDYCTLIESMIRRDHTNRPSIDDILLSTKVASVVDQHKNGIRNNFMVNWESRWQLYENGGCGTTSMESDSEDQINRSPPRHRQNSIANIPPWNRMPLKSCAINKPATPNRYPIHKKVVRKLF